MRTLIDTQNFGITGTYQFFQGKVRDVYDLGDKLLIIATDRVSAFDHVLPNAVPGRGIILTQMTMEWLNVLSDAIAQVESPIPIRHHVVSTDVDDLPEEFKPFANQLLGRFMIVDKCSPIPIEFIVRGYISGSLWKTYQEKLQSGVTGTVTLLGHELPDDLQESQEFTNAIFTPSTKAEAGEHDENIDYDRMVEIMSGWITEKGYGIDAEALAKTCRELSLRLYTTARNLARKNGIIIADTKFEFGIKVIDSKPYLVIIDEVLTPDSSRFWPADKYEIGRGQESFDKQIIRDYLAKVLKWDKQPPIPTLPHHIVVKTMNRYHECADILGASLPQPPLNIMVLVGSANDLTGDFKAAIRQARDTYCANGTFSEINVHVMSIHRNTPTCIALAANELDGIDLDKIDVIIAGAGWANQLAGCMDALLYHNGRYIPVFGLAIGVEGAKEFTASTHSIECLPSYPVILDDAGNAYCNAEGLAAIFACLATKGTPLVKPRTEKKVELFVEID